MPPLKYLGVGLSKTATKSLEAAMIKLGFKTLHWTGHVKGKPEALKDVILGDQNDCSPLRRYDRYDFACDIPHAYYFRRIGAAYPELKYILTVRNVNKWFDSMCRHFPVKACNSHEEQVLHKLVYGAEFPQQRQKGDRRRGNLDEKHYVSRFLEWNATIEGELKGRLLVIDICERRDKEDEEERGKRLWKVLWDFVD